MPSIAEDIYYHAMAGQNITVSASGFLNIYNVRRTFTSNITLPIHMDVIKNNTETTSEFIRLLPTSEV